MKKIIDVGVYYNRLGVNNYNENTLIVALARRLSSVFSFGFNLKYLFWDSEPTKLYDIGIVEEDLDGSAISLDLSGLIEINDDLKLGFVFADINQPNIASELSIVKEKVPFSVKTGIGWEINKWLICADFIFREFSFSQKNPNNREILKKFGVEYPFLNYTLYARGGFSFYNLFESFNFSAGAGYIFQEKYRLDYAFVMPFFSIKSTYGNHYLNVGYMF